MTKNIYDEFRIAVIEAIHSLPYEEAVKKEYEATGYFKNESPYPTTLDRVLFALSKKCRVGGVEMDWYFKQVREADWIWTKEDGFTPATHEDQSEDTLSSILQLLK